MFLDLRWFHFEKVVEELVAQDTYYLNIDKLRPITKQVCHVDDEEELSTMLNFYHDLGVIVKHDRTVVLQAQWLIDLFKQLITVRPFDETVNSDIPHNTNKYGICFWLRNLRNFYLNDLFLYFYLESSSVLR